MKSVMKHDFARVPRVQMPRSSFDRSYGMKLTFNSGYLVPIAVDEVLPGDTYNWRTAAFARLATPLFPFMDNLFLDTFYFFVPSRLLWDNFQRFMGEQDNPDDSIDYLIPILVTPDATDTARFDLNSIGDYFGLPYNKDVKNCSALPHRAYNLIWNTWFRDQNLQDSVPIHKDDGPDSTVDYVLLRRGKRHDYFTSCLPTPQKGDPVNLPIGSSAPLAGIVPVTGIGKLNNNFPDASQPVIESDGSTPTYANAAGINIALPHGEFYVKGTDPTTGIPQIMVDLAAGGTADLSAASAATISQFRAALAVQAFYEQSMRGGTRYIELVKSMFGVLSPDARLQRPEYLGGGSTPINVTPVASTGDTGTLTPAALNVGGLRAFATAAFNGHGFTKSFVEHGYIIALASVRADITYQQGYSRMFNRRDRFDFYWPAFAQLGEQPVFNKEIYYQGIPADDEVFGYQEPYADYRYKPSYVCGAFRSDSPAPLDSWHLAQDYTSLPVLGPDWIQDHPPVERVVQVETEPQFICDLYHHVINARCMPLYGIPASLTRF